MSTRSELLAERVALGAQNLIDAVQDLTSEQWATLCPNEARTVGVLVHHVGSAYAAEAGAVGVLAAQGGLAGITVDAIDAGNAAHAAANPTPTKDEALGLIRDNSPLAVAAVRNLTDEQLDRVAATAYHRDAPVTVQYFVEQHPIAHPYVHLTSIRAALEL